MQPGKTAPFDRVDWPSLWKALSSHGVSENLVWMLQVLYTSQTGQIVGEKENKNVTDRELGLLMAGVTE